MDEFEVLVFRLSGDFTKHNAIWNGEEEKIYTMFYLQRVDMLNQLLQ